MISRRWIGAALLVLILITIPSVCAAPGGILHTGPGTTIDGTAAIDGMHVLGGQLLRTATGHFSELFTRGSSLRLLGNTRLQFLGTSADLLAGGVSLSTSTQFSTRSDCAYITPRSLVPSRYLVQVQDRTVYVTAQQEATTVKARKAVTVPAGKTVAVYCGSAAQNIVFLSTDLPAKVIMGSAVAATPLGAIPQAGWKQNLSSKSPFDR